MTSSTRISQFVKQDLWTKDLKSMPLIQRLGIQALRLATAVGMEFRNRLLDARAAGLVFTTLLSLVPFLAVMFSVLKAFGIHHVIEPSLAQALEPLGPKGQEITTTIVRFVDNIKIGVLGVVGIGGLFYTTYSLIDKIEQALNAIWQVREGRTWGRKFADYLSAVLVGPVLVF
ncbi:MAG: YihY/virulence factor BrkB family protein, partial [Nitrospira sp.]|nr:YihY/virulence factor BrkB family protein [Nitrospira sp.]